jgi:hypothetical protein
MTALDSGPVAIRFFKMSYCEFLTPHGGVLTLAKPQKSVLRTLIRGARSVIQHHRCGRERSARRTKKCDQRSDANRRLSLLSMFVCPFIAVNAVFSATGAEG